MITIIDEKYVVRLPEFGVYQDIDPSTGRPFADEATAQGWADEFTATVAAQEEARKAAEEARLAAIVRVEITADKLRVTLGDTVTLSAVMKNGLNAVVPLDDDFAVPVENERGEVILIKLALFQAGKATVVFKPTRSGYHCITETGINHKLPAGMHIAMPEPLEIVVFE